MCGFLISYSKLNNIKNFENAFSTLVARGPDSSKIIIDDDYICGFKRLSIIDENERSMQPFTDGKYTIVFNGEIYNYKELKQLLISSGINNFKTESDTEILLKGFIRFGIDYLKKIIGMYSFVIINKENNELLFLRDEFGIKPLYFFKNNEKLIISSNIKAITRLNTNQKSINKFNLINFNFYGFTYGEETIYKEIYEARPGVLYNFNIKKNKIEKKEIFSLKNFFYDKSANEFSIDDIKKTIKFHLVSDVNTCVLRSHGLDSNIISKFKNEIENDDSYIRYNNKKLNFDLNLESEQTVIKISDYEEIFDEYLRVQEFPTLDGFNIYLITKYIKKFRYKVCLSGLGLDEILNGYNLINRIKILKKLNPFKQFFKLTKLNDLKIDKIEKETKKNSFLDSYLNIRRVSTIKDVLNKFTIQEIKEFEDELRDKIYSNLKISEEEIKSDINCLRLIEFEFYLKNQLLKDGDFFSMQNSVELRVPFVEKNFIKSVIEDSKSLKQKRIFFKNFIDGELLNKIEKQKKGFFAHNYKYINKFKSNQDIIKIINDKL